MEGGDHPPADLPEEEAKQGNGEPDQRCENAEKSEYSRQAPKG